jgi:hypothetical protein
MDGTPGERMIARRLSCVPAIENTTASASIQAPRLFDISSVSRIRLPGLVDALWIQSIVPGCRQ